MPGADLPAGVEGLYARSSDASRPTPYGVQLAATRVTDGVPVELEVLSPALSADPALRTRLVDGGNALRSLAGRHVVRVLHVVLPADDGPVVLVRDRFPSTPLDQARRDAGGTLPPSRAVATAVDVLDGLVEVHAAGLVHGALSARDVLLDESVPLRTVVRVTGSGAAALLGRPVDVPPAPGAGPVPGPADDVWAAGALLALLLTGGDVRDGDVGAGDGPWTAGLPPALVAALLPMLAPDPTARPTAAQAREALRGVRGLSGPPAPVTAARPPAPAVRPEGAPASRTGPTPDTSRHRRTPGRRLGAPALVAVLVTVLAVLAFGGALLWSGSDRPVVEAPASSPQSAVGPLVLAAVEGPQGLRVERTWTVDAAGTSLRGRTVVRNDGPRAVVADIDEIVPATISPDVRLVTFSPDPQAVVGEGLGVRYAVSLASGQDTEWVFDARLDDPVRTEQALAALGADAVRARTAHEATLAAVRTARLVRLSLVPATLALQPGQTTRVAVSARYSDGSVRSGGAIAGLTIRSANTNVVRTRGDLVRGRAAGRALLVAESGQVRATTLVVVAPAALRPPAASRSAAPARPSSAPSARVPARPSLTPTSARPAPVRATTTAPRPRVSAAPRRSSAAPRPRASTTPRPATAAPRPTSAAPRPTRQPSPPPASGQPAPRATP